jgi:hypothetical protein
MTKNKADLIKEFLTKVKSANKELTATRLGKLRLDIKKHLAAEMKENDKLVKKVVG